MKQIYAVLVLAVVFPAGFCLRTAAAPPDNPDQAFLLVSKSAARASIIASPVADRAERTALAKLNAGIQRDGGIALPTAQTTKQKSGHFVVIGTAKSNPVLNQLAKQFNLPLLTIEPQGFLLRTLVDGDRHYFIIAGGDSRGVLYGAQEALDQVISCTPTGEVFVTSCDIQKKPALGVRGTYCLTCWGACPRYDRVAWEEAIDSMADAGMNRVMFWMDGLFRSRRHPEAFLNQPKQHYHDAKLTDEDIHKLIAYAHDRGMDFYMGSGVFAWFSASEAFAKKYKEAADHSGGNLCPSSPVAQKVTLEYLSEMNDIFPEADGYMLEIRDELNDCMCPICQKPLDKFGSKQFGQSELDLLQKLTDTVWKKHPQTKFIWLMGYANHKNDPMYYERMRTIGHDPRMEWLEVRMSWKLPSADGTDKPLKYFSDRIYHWDPYYRFPPDAMQDRVRQTVAAELNGYLPAYEPGFANLSIYDTNSPIPFPVRLIPFCLTQFYYREFIWDPRIKPKMLLERAHRKFFTAEVPPHFADDLLFMRQFMAAHYVGLSHSIGAGLGPDGSGLIDTVKDVWTVARKGGDERKQNLLESLGAEIRRFQNLVEGKGDMGRLIQMEKQMAELRPHASRRSITSFDLIQRSIDDIRVKVSKCKDYIAEAKPALVMINQHLEELRARNAKSPSQP